jgi:hypothetical protein
MATAASVSTLIPTATGVGKRRAMAVVGASLAPSAVWLIAQAIGVEFDRRGRS